MKKKEMEERIAQLERELSDLKSQMLTLALRQPTTIFSFPLVYPPAPYPAPFYPEPLRPIWNEPSITCGQSLSVQ
jgi:hypothetical protein